MCPWSSLCLVGRKFRVRESRTSGSHIFKLLEYERHCGIIHESTNLSYKKFLLTPITYFLTVAPGLQQTWPGVQERVEHWWNIAKRDAYLSPSPPKPSQNDSRDIFTEKYKDKNKIHKDKLEVETIVDRFISKIWKMEKG
jgi:hypothetical protein